MLFQEPQRTEYDWNFRLLGIPVRVHPFFWLLVLLLGMGGNDSRGILIWVMACFVSILIHEMGHALTIRYFGWTPHIVLYSFGGLAIYDPSFSPLQYGGRRPRRTGMTQILISLAGPGAGFVFAAAIMALLLATGHPLASISTAVLERGDASELIDSPVVREIRSGAGGGMVLFGRYWVLIDSAEISTSLQRLIWDLLQVNILWGLLNLLPIYPLDGGQVAREVFLANSNDGVRRAMILSFVTAAAIAVYALMRSQTYLALMFGYMAYMNYTQLSGPFGGSFGGSMRRRPW